MKIMADANKTVNCYEYVHEDPYKTFAHVVNGYMSTGCVLLGTIGNMHGVKSVHMTNLDKNRGVVLAVSMLALAFWDTILLWCAFMYYGVKQLPMDFETDVLNLLTPWFHAFSQIANTASIWCVVAITLQRFMATRDPFRTSRSTTVIQSFRSERRISFIYCSTYRRLFRMPFVLSICAVLLNFPSFFEIHTVPCYSTRLHRMSVNLRPTWLRLDPTYTMYRLLSRMVVISIGPNIFILCVTLLTVFILRGSNRSRRQLFQMSDNLLERYASRENMQTMISIMLVTKFLCFRSLTFALDIMEVTVGVTNYYLIDISNFLVLVNSATNCLIFLKATSWLNSRFAERQTIKRKKTICDSGQLLGDRLTILNNSWQQALCTTNGQLGLRVLYSMLRKHPPLFNVIKNANNAERSNEPEMVSLLTNGSCRRSFDLITNSKYQEVADRITTFITELLQLTSTAQPETYIIMRIRRVGAIHYDKGIQFPSSVWKEFKSSLITIISECDFPSQTERDAALDAWNIFISFIIREMKMGTWAIGDTLGQMP
ncbi:unnamed protein product [Caenorhabditis auriculariae]|uniref:G-protein coupled receptors family 1 profile domain-containing protein n=1 Tax=Caenorhabditis auriculariae TaxID=2777116 RepID=A0A8S1HA25_9PELO|nr:unnamed protein product [Caenorhabditis auriculariae]